MAGNNELHVRRTLVIGLGSTGKDVVEKVAEHLNWQFGDFRKVPWVRLLALETVPGGSILGDRLIWSGMTQAEFAPYRNAPNQAGSEFDFPKWQDPATLGPLQDANAGAGNCRMLGRLCLLHPRTYSQLQMRVQKDIGELDQLTEKNIADGLGNPSLMVEKFPEITAYVVGTLCGGTCSGGAADMGYLLEAWMPGRVQRQAIFTIPHPQFRAAPRHKKNAYYALKELNHYFLQPDNPWEQKLPGFNEPIVLKSEPYQFCYVMMPGGPDANDVPRLNGMIAQYLAAACGKAGYKVAECDADGFSHMTNARRMGFMRPRFSTLGVASLEFPGEHIQRAATNLLISSTIDGWLQNSFINNEDMMELTRVTNFDDLQKSLVEFAEQKILSEVQNLKNQPVSVDAFWKIVTDIDDKIKAINDQPMDNLATLLIIMKKNQDAILNGIDAEIHGFVEKYLCDIDGGPGFVAGILRKRMQDMQEWANEVAEKTPVKERDASTLYNIMQSKVEEVENIQKKIIFPPWKKKEMLKDAWDQANSAATEYLNANLRLYCLKHMSRQSFLNIMMNAYKDKTALLLERLQHLEAAFGLEATTREKDYKEKSATCPEINGKVYFEKNKTVEDWYDKLIEATRWPNEPAGGWKIEDKRLAVRKEVLEAIKTSVLSEIRKGKGQSCFDNKPLMNNFSEYISTEIRDHLEQKAKSFFINLREREHILHLAQNADISSVISQSAPAMSISSVMIPAKLNNEEGYPAHPDDLAMMDNDTAERLMPDRMKQLSATIGLQLQLHAQEIVNSDDPFRLLIIRQSHGFTFGQMEGVVQKDDNDLLALQSTEYCQDFPFWYTRRDVTWVDPIIPSAVVERVQEEWLLTILLGLPDDGLISFMPAAKGEIDKEGWYRIINGEFDLLPLLGDTDSNHYTMPLEFTSAINNLIMTENAKISRRLSIRLSGYLHKVGAERFVEAVDLAYRALGIFAVKDIDMKRAEELIKRYYRRNGTLAGAFFDYSTKTDKDIASQFAHLYHHKEDPIGEGKGVFAADAYYCPKCNNLLGNKLSALHDAMFICPVCGERYWP